MKKILVTGASGFLGNAVTKRLAEMENFETIAVISGRHSTWTFFPKKVHVEIANLLNENERVDLMQRVRPDIMLHLAWGMQESNFKNSEENLKWLEASLHLCRLFHKYKGTRLIFAGSHTEYGIGYPGRTEQNFEELFTLYGACKLAYEKVASNFCERNHIEFAVGRYFTLYGPKDNRIIDSALTEAIRNMLGGKVFVCQRPWNIWDYVYIEDAAEATIRLLESDYCGTINIASGSPRTMKDVFSLIAEIIGSPELLMFNWKSEERHICSANIEIMKSVLHYQCPTSFREGLEKTIQWWREKE